MLETAFELLQLSCSPRSSSGFCSFSQISKWAWIHPSENLPTMSKANINLHQSHAETYDNLASNFVKSGDQNRPPELQGHVGWSEELPSSKPYTQRCANYCAIYHPTSHTRSASQLLCQTSVPKSPGQFLPCKECKLALNPFNPLFKVQNINNSIGTETISTSNKYLV